MGTLGRVLVFWAVIMTAFFVGAQTPTPTPEIPDCCRMACLISSEEICQACIEDGCEEPTATPTATPPATPTATPTPDHPPEFYELPRTVGVTQLAYDLNWETWGADVPHPHARWTTLELLDDISSRGIRAVKIWFKGDPFDGTGSWCWSPHYWTGSEPFSCAFGSYGFEDMDAVWSHPGIDVYTMRFQSEAWSIREHNPRTYPMGKPKLSGTSFANEPTFDIARTLFERFGDLDKTIIIGDWEQDWQIRGQNSRGVDNVGRWLFPWDDAPHWYYDEMRPACVARRLADPEWRPWICAEYGRCHDDMIGRECYEDTGAKMVFDRMDWVLRYIERRQEGVEAARALFPDATLRVFHAVTVNRYPGIFTFDGLGISLTEEIAGLDPQPDLIGISFWDRHTTIAEALDYIEAETGYARERIFVDEFGEWREADQYERIWNEGRRAQCWGVNLLNVWMWRETWEAEIRNNGTQHQHGLFYQTNIPREGQEPIEFGDPRPGYFALQDLIAWTPTESECLEVMALPPTRGDDSLTPTPTVTATPTPKPTKAPPRRGPRHRVR